jgi:hypothetical protein
MTREVQINVTAEDIEHGKGGDCNECPIARGLNRWLGGSFYARVGGYTVSVADPALPFAECDVYTCRLPEEATRFIGAFDRDSSPEPFSFMLTLPTELLKPELRNLGDLTC